MFTPNCDMLTTVLNLKMQRGFVQIAKPYMNTSLYAPQTIDSFILFENLFISHKTFCYQYVHSFLSHAG